MSKNGADRGGFCETRWSLVMSARRGSGKALEELCRIYWFPIYAFLRRGAGKSHEDAEDLTQGTLQKLIELEGFEHANPDRGKMRTYLISCAKKFMANEHRNRNAAKRGSGAALISIDATDADGRYLAEPSTDLTPIEYFDRKWGLAVIDQAGVRLRQKYAGQEALFSALEPHLMGRDNAESYSVLSTRLDKSEGALRKAAFTMRKRFAECIREVVADTVDNEGEIAGEIAHLMHAVRSIPDNRRNTQKPPSHSIPPIDA